jgi:hypothetical protein
MAGTGFNSVMANRAPMPRFAMTGKTSWQTALKCTAVCHNRNNSLAIRSQLAFHSTIIFFMAIHGAIIFFMAIHGKLFSSWYTFER